MGSSTIVHRAERAFVAFVGCATLVALTIAGFALARERRSCGSSLAIGGASASPGSPPRGAGGSQIASGSVEALGRGAPRAVPAPPAEATVLMTPADLPSAPPLVRRARSMPAAAPSAGDDQVLGDPARR